jgi:peptidoglycan/xylan/chitin deacetylase (PgdA/CDA1 family)
MMKLFSGVGSILMLHRVAPYQDGNIVYNENMKISPDELEAIILDLKSQGICFISLDKLVEYHRQNYTGVERFVVITLDDGYGDNLKYGYPLFKKHNIPFCIYVTNCFPDRTTNLWWYALEKLVFQNEKVDGSDNRSIQQKQQNFLLLRRKIIDHYFRDPIDYLKQHGSLSFDLDQEIDNLCLSWSEVISLSNDPLVTIGCHTLNHYPLKNLNPSEARQEIIQSKNALENKIMKPVKHFAFPFGSKKEAGARDYDIAASAGFDTIVTTVHGHVHPSDSLHYLDRIFLYPLGNNNTTLNRILYWNIRSGVAAARKLILSK